MLDFHTHILPYMDDGSESVAESIEMISMLEKQGVDKILLTPHFYAYKTSIDEFLEKRESSLHRLIEGMKAADISSEIYVGAEVLYFDDLWRVEDLKSLCIVGTKYILVEMPFSKWTDSIIEGIDHIISRGYTPIIVHFERYIPMQDNMKYFYTLIRMGAYFQMNCDYLTKFFKRRRAVSMIKSGMVRAIGTDCHNMTTRKPDYEKAVNYLKSKMKEKDFLNFNRKQENIIKLAVNITDSDYIDRLESD